MPIDMNKIVCILDDAKLTPDKRGPLLSLALARAVGYSLDLPTSQVNDPASFYIGNVQTLAEQIVSQVNEQVSVDVLKTCDLIKAVWTFRYRLVYNANNPSVRAFLDSLVRVGSTEFPGYVSELMIALPENNKLDYIASMIQEQYRVSSEPSMESNSNKASVAERVIANAEGTFGAKRGSIKTSTNIRRDLKVKEYDFEKFIERLEKTFKVEMLKDGNVDGYQKFRTIQDCVARIEGELRMK